MATCLVTSIILHPTGEPWQQGEVRFQPLSQSTPGPIVIVFTDTAGALSVELPAGLDAPWRVMLPDGKDFEIEIPDLPGFPSFSLEELRFAYDNGRELPL